MQPRVAKGAFEVIPAIDLRGGRCVRLFQGDFDRETVFSANPVEMALRWESLGAPRLHIVDLDGAASGRISHGRLIEDIVKKVRIQVQVGGGIRDLKTIEGLVAAGVARCILGTAAVEDENFLTEALGRFGDSLIISIDAREGLVSTRGWKTQTKLRAVDLARTVVTAGTRRIIYTDIQSDGTLGEPNFGTLSDMVAVSGIPVIAAGGVSRVEHIARLKGIGAEGAIIGKALYVGQIDLTAALNAAKK